MPNSIEIPSVVLRFGRTDATSLISVHLCTPYNCDTNSEQISQLHKFQCYYGRVVA